MSFRFAEPPPPVPPAPPPPAHTGVMLSYDLPPELARALALPGGEPPEELHLTLAFLGQAAELGGLATAAAARVAARWADRTPPITASVGGLAVFNTPQQTAGQPPTRPLVLLIDAPGIHDAQADLVRSLASARLPVARDFEYTPHVTLAYLPRWSVLPPLPPKTAFTIDCVHLHVGGTLYGRAEFRA